MMRRLLSRFRLTSTIAIAVAVLAVAAGAALVSAHVGSVAPGVIHTCVKPNSGEFKLVGAGEACKQNESSIDWNAVGPAGAPGAAGTNGTNGLIGSTLVTSTVAVVGSLLAQSSVVTATATCDDGKVLLSGGGKITSTHPTIEALSLTASYPSSTTEWTAVGVGPSFHYNQVGIGPMPPLVLVLDTTTVTAYALCSL